MLSYGVRSKCCYAPVHVAQRKVKGTRLKVTVWVCNACRKKDVALVDYNPNPDQRATQTKDDTSQFIDEDMDPHDPSEE